GGAAARPPGGDGGVRRPAGEDDLRHTGADGRRRASLARTVERFRALSGEESPRERPTRRGPPRRGCSPPGPRAARPATRAARFGGRVRGTAGLTGSQVFLGRRRRGPRRPRRRARPRVDAAVYAAG